ncbi:MAG TPA: ABC transporter permease [Sulfurospirillum arcachonense]|nr:ABC transporter permease [Sulfurospirillum arcachonense]HIP44970.1 ABC transporter permease [Sulfurospirillum arcachonense]
MFSAMVKKEFLLVLRDKRALAVLFLMPALFILIISVAMRDVFTQNSVIFEITIVDLEKSKVTKEMINDISKNRSFQVADNANIVITIPQKYSQSKKRLKIEIKDSLKSDEIELFKAKLLKDITNLKLKIIKNRLTEFSDEAGAAIDNISLESDELFELKYNQSEEIPNSTQQSVPSWIVFGMFFMITPISTVFINERKQNTLSRLNSMNVSVFSMVLSKIVPYLFIAQIQAFVMIAVGMFIVPLFDTPALAINGSVLALVFLSFALSLSAVGLASLIAVSSNSTEQASTIGGIMSILLGAIGGVMVPKFIMPDFMQTLANISPMSWGLDGFLDIFLRGGGIAMVLNEALMLMLFGSIALGISMVMLHARIKKGFE